MTQKKCGGMIWHMLFLLLVSVFALGGCRILDTRRADGGLSAGAQPWAIAAGSGNDEFSRLGAAQNPRILASYGGEYRDAKLERMVAKIVGRLAAVSDTPKQSYQVVILDSPNINAFALPGGYVYVTRGLLALANDSAEIAAVIAHEMAHISANHGALRARKEKEIALSDRVAQEVLAGGQRDETLIRGKIKLAGFSREQELQADSLGIRMMSAAGYDAFASSRFLQAMAAYSRFRDISGAADAGLDFLSNHPSAPQRGLFALNAARKMSAPAVGETDRAAFLRGIDGMIFGDDSRNADSYIRGRSFIDNQAGIMFTVPTGFVLKQENNAVTAAGANETALRFDSAELKKMQLPAEYIVSGRFSGLEANSVTSKIINNFPAAEARARTDRWQFHILVLAVKNRIYRFLTAAPKGGADPAAIGEAAANSFRLLNVEERQGVKPLRLQIRTVGAGETIESLAAKMQFNDRSAELFRILNGLSANQTVRAGEQVKLIMQ